MPRKSVTFEQFVRAVHRRQVVIAILERAGLGLVVGCAVATVLVSVVLWRGGEDAWAIAILALSVGAVVGAVAGAVTRPSAIASASEADRQLGTADLLSTAFVLSGARSNDPWRQTVLALAAEQCRRHTPGEVMLRRLGVRAWGGILLAAAFVAVLTALSSASREAVAARTVGNDTTAAAQRDAERPANQPIVQLADVTEPAARQHRMELSPEDRQSSASDVPAPQPSPDSQAKPETRGTRDTRTANTDAASSGGSQAMSSSPRAPKADRPKLPEPTDAAHDDATAARNDGSPRAGVGRAARSNQIPSDSASGGVITGAHDNPSNHTAPWTSNTWPQTVEAAGQELRAGRVPDDARDLVRGYFDPAASGR